MEWYLENVLLLVKLEFMSDRNYYFINVVDQGRKVAWAYIVHEKIMMEIQEIDKRKSNKTSRLGSILGVIFSQLLNLKTLDDDSFPTKIKPYLQGEKHVGDDTLDEPSTQQTKLNKLN